MPDKLSVNVEGVDASATQVQGHGDDFAAGHSAAATRIWAAHGGWAGQSAQSLGAWAATLGKRAEALVTNVDDHGQHLHTTARTFAVTEERRADKLADVYRG
ncbi:WXG100 family type VII secretion target [Mycolicibacterium sarraceniae]|uniref:WXG100 family type VII secretion target n=1 Tax=Mycolicibacterium sarraceniae TaxID=1534348 RepID=A0A7I7SQJ5_9MYCO|nr:WXG100 family type VII secretion target [Mycolicibacterium sarraceniae]BBY58086.1 hypothetical protein MSAR_12220 [Mycolicibacterium sarraceniae]